MLNFKRLTKRAFCVLLILSATVATSCGKKQTSSSAPEPPVCEHEWGEWQLVSEPDCTAKGVKRHVCQKDPSHVETAEFSARGHHYDNGVCSVCGDGPVFPVAPTSIEYVTLSGAGGEYTRYECTEGYYEVTIHQDDVDEDTEGVEWLSFSVPNAGQYALYTVAENSEELSSAVKIVRHDASFASITFPGHDARKLDDGNYYSSVNCGTIHWNMHWRATFAVHGNAGDRVKVRFVRISDPIWIPSNVYEDAYAQEINGVKAPEGGANELLKSVPYETEYFYDETVGYYRTGTQQEPGKIIYAAITADEPRMFPNGGALTDVYLGGGNYAFHHSNTIEGDYLIKNYGWFLLSNGALGTYDNNRNFIPNASDPNANCYENFVNSDGMYPVTKELHEFLVLYTKANHPSDFSGESEDAWLAFCSYYVNATGTQQAPFLIGVGTTEVTTVAMSYRYYTLTTGETNATYTVATAQQGAVLYLDGESYGEDGNGFSVSVTDGATFRIAMKDGSKATFEIMVTEQIG